jgi:hypothetical protein
MEDVLVMLSQVTKPPELLGRFVDSLRKDMEQANTPSNGFRSFGGLGGGAQSSKQSIPNWRNSSTPFAAKGGGNGISSSTPPLKYQSKFTTPQTNMDDKILNSVIGNKLNLFTSTTYNDTRDFIYQIIDSGETEFIKDFLEKVFIKATLEDKYCKLYAKLIAEIAERYPIINDEVNRYHIEFLKVFDSIEEEDKPETLNKRQYRLGYGQFISELASFNALDKSQLFIMIKKVKDLIYTFSLQENKVRSVEQLVDCITRLVKSLKECSPKFFKVVQNDIKEIVLEDITKLIENKAGKTPSLIAWGKSYCGLMDLRDFVIEE